MLSSVVSNAIGFTSYETGLRWYRDAHPGRSPTPMERACIAGTAAATRLMETLGAKGAVQHCDGRRGGVLGCPAQPVPCLQAEKAIQAPLCMAISSFAGVSADAQLERLVCRGVSACSATCCTMQAALQNEDTVA